MKKHSRRGKKKKNPLDEQLLRVIGRNTVALRNTPGMPHQLLGLEAGIPQRTLSRTDVGPLPCLRTGPALGPQGGARYRVLPGVACSAEQEHPGAGPTGSGHPPM